jgi:putative transposase
VAGVSKSSPRAQTSDTPDRIAGSDASDVEAHAPRWLSGITRVRCGRTERLFWQSGGGYDRNLVEPRTLAAAIGYVHQNPVRRGLVSRAVDGRWSSAGWFEGTGRNPLRPDRLPPERTTG